MAPYQEFFPEDSGSFQPETYVEPAILKFIRALPRYGYTRNLLSILTNGDGIDNYIEGIVISSCILLIIFLVWCIILIYLKLYTNNWASGSLSPPPEPQRKFTRGRQEKGSENDESDSNSQSSGEESHYSCLSIDSSIFYNDPEEGEEMTMEVIAREQRRDKSLQQQKKNSREDFSTTTNGKITLVTIKDNDRFCVYVPQSLRLALLRTYHDCLIHPDDVNNPEKLIYEYFTWRGIRLDVDKYVTRYRETMSRGDNGAMVVHGDVSDEDSLDENTPITLDVIAREQVADLNLKNMMERVPHVFSNAANGSVQLITARGRDNKYRIVIPKSLQAKVMRTYHDCLVNPTDGNNFEKVLYQHFTWNGIHRDVADYARNEGLTDEMRDRSGSRRKNKRNSVKLQEGNYLNRRRRMSSSRENNGDLIGTRLMFTSDTSQDSSAVDSEDTHEPIGLDEIAREQKNDKELRQLKREEPFVFSTVRYGNTLLTTAQNFRDNKYRIVIPYSLQGRMLLTYRDCLLNPTPDKNFDTLLYNHFTWNGIHDDVDYFVKNGGSLPKKVNGGVRSNIGQPELRKSTNNRNASNMKKKRKRRNSEYDEEYSVWLNENNAFCKKMKIIRICFLFSGILLILSSIMFFQRGVKRVFNSLDDAQAGLDVAEDTINEVLDVTYNYFETRSDIQETAQMIGTYEVEQWCPNSPDELTDFSREIRNATYHIGVQLRDSATQLDTELEGIQNSIHGLLVTIKKADETLEDFKRYTNAARILVILIDLVALSLMLSCILAWNRAQHHVPICVRNSFIIPFFVIFIILFWVFSTASLLGAMAGSDFCKSPDESALALVSKNHEKMSPLMLSFLVYYITGCHQDRIPEKFNTLSQSISRTGNFLHDQVANLDAVTKTFLARRCGETGPYNLISALELTDLTLHGVYSILFDVRQLMQCHNFNPIYTSTTYNAVCTSGVGGMSWMFMASLSMALFSMMMVTFRVAIIQY